MAGAKWSRCARLPGLGSDLSYSAAVTLLLVAVWTTNGTIAMVLNSPSGVTTPQVAVLSLAGLLSQSFRMLLTVPIIAIAANRAPAAGVMRYLVLGVGGFLCIVWWYLAGKLMGEPGPIPGLDSVAAATLQAIATAYRSSARTTGDALARQQTDDARLDAELKQSRLQLLRAQIEPHFLFNTLATVRTLGRIDPAAAVDMIDNLMRYLSESLPKLRQDETTLADEQQLVVAYLRIHQIRMGSRLHFDFVLPPDLRQVRIPTMILLTLVENALKHGVQSAIAGGTIQVSAARDGAMLLLKVADSGKGMSVTEGNGTGLANIRQRLTMRYGERAALTLVPQEPRGTIATVLVPQSVDP